MPVIDEESLVMGYHLDKESFFRKEFDTAENPIELENHLYSHDLTPPTSSAAEPPLTAIQFQDTFNIRPPSPLSAFINYNPPFDLSSEVYKAKKHSETSFCVGDCVSSCSNPQLNASCEKYNLTTVEIPLNRTSSLQSFTRKPSAPIKMYSYNPEVDAEFESPRSTTTLESTISTFSLKLVETLFSNKQWDSSIALTSGECDSPLDCDRSTSTSSLMEEITATTSLQPIITTKLNDYTPNRETGEQSSLLHNDALDYTTNSTSGSSPLKEAASSSSQTTAQKDRDWLVPSIKITAPTPPSTVQNSAHQGVTTPTLQYPDHQGTQDPAHQGVTTPTLQYPDHQGTQDPAHQEITTNMPLSSSVRAGMSFALVCHSIAAAMTDLKRCIEENPSIGMSRHCIGLPV